MKKSLHLQTFVRVAMMTALSTVLTMFPQIPSGNGYLHFGDCIIYLTAILMGPIPGALAGGIGHALADILSGYPVFALPTLLIKGAIGFCVGKLLYGSKKSPVRLVLAALTALILVTVGYFLAELPLYGLGSALLVFVTSPLQWLMSVVAAWVLFPILTRLQTKIHTH